MLHNGLSWDYVVDMKVDENTEQMFNIRTLEEFLKEKDPKQLENLLEQIESQKD